MLDTHDALTDRYKHMRSSKQIKSSLQKNGASNIMVWKNGNGIEALDCIDDEYDFLGFIDDNHTTFKNDDYPVFGRDAINKYDKVSILAVPGNSNNFLKRYKIISSLV